MTPDFGIFAPQIIRMRMTPKNPLFLHAHQNEIRINLAKNGLLLICN